MNKVKLCDFLKRYNLQGAIERVKLVNDSKKLTCDFSSLDKSVIGYLTLDNFDLEDFEIGIYTTSELLALLDVLEDTIDVDFKKNGDRIISLQMKDSMTELNYVLADSSIIDDVPQLSQEPDYETCIIINQEFSVSFLKALSALGKDCRYFQVKSTGKQTTMLMNYSQQQVNSIKFKVEVKDDKHFKSEENLVFPTEQLKNILSANKSFEEAKFEISDAGLGKITIKDGEFVGHYFLPMIQ